MGRGAAWRRVSMVVDRDVEARMRDGTILRADVYRPAEGGPFPTLLMRTPYDRSQPMAPGAIPDPLTATARGYAVVSPGRPGPLWLGRRVRALRPRSARRLRHRGVARVRGLV